LISEPQRILFLTSWIITLFTGNHSTYAVEDHFGRSRLLRNMKSQNSFRTTENHSTWVARMSI